MICWLSGKKTILLVISLWVLTLNFVFANTSDEANSHDTGSETTPKDFQYILKMGSLISYHTYLSNYDFKNKLTKNGRIIISPAYLQIEKNYLDYGIHLFLSTDSIASPILGIMGETVIDQNEKIKTTLFAGGYFVSASAWGRVKNHPKYFTSIIKDRIGLAVPVVGYKAEYRLYQGESFKLSSVLAVSLTLVHLGFFYNFPL